LAPYLPKPARPDSWTEKAPLPGGDFPVQGFEALVNQLQARYRALDPSVISRLARAYGTLVPDILGDARSAADLGRSFGAGLTESELNYLAEREWAMSAEDVVWRRSKLGLRLSKVEIEEIDAFLKVARPAAQAAVGGWLEKSGVEGDRGLKVNESKDPEYWYTRAEKDGNTGP
jgi:glycerol-3-phosphate dehydrogenase